jgi:hypothetical protein
MRPSCACGNVALAYCARRPSAAKGVREGPHYRGQSLPFRARDEIRLLSKGGRSSRQAGSVKKPNCIYTTTKPCQLSVMWVNKGLVCPSFRLLAPSSLSRFRRSTSWYVIGPCKPPGRHILDQCEPRFVCQKSPAAQHQPRCLPRPRNGAFPLSS